MGVYIAVKAAARVVAVNTLLFEAEWHKTLLGMKLGYKAKYIPDDYMADFHTLNRVALFRECDCNGVVHPSNYFKWFEDSRFLVAEDSKIYQLINSVERSTFPVVYSDYNFYHPINAGDAVQVRTTPSIEGSGLLAFRHCILKNENPETIADGITKVVILSEEMGLIKTIDEKIKNQIVRYTSNYEGCAE